MKVSLTMKALLAPLGALTLLTLPGLATGYPIDGYDWTGIGRLEANRRIEEGIMKGKKQPPGALLPLDQVDLRLLDQPNLALPLPDPTFTRRIVGLLGRHASRYGIAVLDLSDRNRPRYAEHNGNQANNPGSVGKLLVVLGLFQALADVYPHDIEARLRVLRNALITADAFHHSDSHTVRLWNPRTQALSRRPLRDGDRASLWTYLDWMISPSSNAAASMVMKNMMLLRHFGTAYPVPEAEGNAFFRNTPKRQLGDLLVEAIQEPVTRNGLDLQHLRQGSFFTRGGKNRVPGTNSYATARQLMKYVLRMEQGRLVDKFSSREIKRLMYVTERRIRYASSPTLLDSAVYFKSGSLYSCARQAGFKCGKYRGNRYNYMNSVAIVEYPPGGNRLFYIVTLMSNVLRKNSASDHQSLGTRIHRLIRDAHSPVPVAAPSK